MILTKATVALDNVFTGSMRPESFIEKFHGCRCFVDRNNFEFRINKNNILYHENQNKNNIPFSSGSDERYISPVVFSETVFATTHIRTTDGSPSG
jgi:hypothetical protein